MDCPGNSNLPANPPFSGHRSKQKARFSKQLRGSLIGYCRISVAMETISSLSQRWAGSTFVR